MMTTHALTRVSHRACCRVAYDRYHGSTLNTLFPTLITDHDNTPAGMERWLYLTQALQTRCVTSSVESYRQHSTIAGALNWAINSIWVGPAWGSISHDGSWKMLHYRLRHVFQDVLLSFVRYVPSSSIAQGAMPSDCPENSTCLHLSNHLVSGVASSLCSLEVRDFSHAETRFSANFSAAAAASSGAMAAMFETSSLLQKAGCTPTECFFVASCTLSGSTDVVTTEPYFPSELAAASLDPAALSVVVTASTGTNVTLTLNTNTTVP